MFRTKVFEKAVPCDYQAESSHLLVQYDGVQGDDFYFDLMKVHVQYIVEPDDYLDHEFGRALLTGSVLVSELTLLNAVVQYSEHDVELKTWPIGTDVLKLPGFNQTDLDYFQDKLDKYIR